MTALTNDITQLRDWIGKTESVTDSIDARQARLMQVTLDRAASHGPGDALPPFWHYLYFNPEVAASDLKDDGHEKLGRFLPPVDLPRRVWAGGEVTFHAPLRIGQSATKVSTIRDIEMKEGRSGQLCLVTVKHQITAGDTPCLTEVQNIIYREMPPPGTPQPPDRPAPDDTPRDAAYTITPDPVMLFRYSALIFYGHRIHYDADYTRDTEGYPGLVVHGPLMAALLAGFAADQRPGQTLRHCTIRALSPVFCGQPLQIEARHDGAATHTCARKDSGALAMNVTLDFDRDA